jgi:hypothetical protein
MTIEVRAEHVVRCCSCGGEHCAGGVNEQGLWYGYCMDCGVRFWDRRAETSNPPPVPRRPTPKPYTPNSH